MGCLNSKPKQRYSSYSRSLYSQGDPTSSSLTHSMLHTYDAPEKTELELIRERLQRLVVEKERLENIVEDRRKSRLSRSTNGLTQPSQW